MLSAPLRENEAACLSALHALGVLDTPPDEELTALVQTAAQACGVPIAMISLIDTDREWFMASVGLAKTAQIPREYSLGAHVVLGDGLFEVPDAKRDLRFVDHPLVSGIAGIRFFAGLPLRLSDGSRIGALCLLDRKPRWIADPQRGVLLHLARTIARNLEARRPAVNSTVPDLETQPQDVADTALLDAEWVQQARDEWADTQPLRRVAEAPDARELLRITLELTSDAVLVLDNDNKVTAMNPAAERLSGWTAEDAIGLPVDQVALQRDPDTRTPLLDDDLSTEALLVARDGTEYRTEARRAPLLNRRGHTLGTLLVLHDRTEPCQLASDLRAQLARDAAGVQVSREAFDIRLRQLLLKVREDHSQHSLLLVAVEHLQIRSDNSVTSLLPPPSNELPWQQVGRLLAQRVRSRDTVAWLGQDRFAVILEHCTSSQALRVAQQLCEKITTLSYLQEGKGYTVSACIGMVPLDKRWGSAAPLLQAADTACQAALARGHSHVYAWLDSEQVERARQRDLQVGARIQQTLLVTLPPQDLESLQISSFSQASQGIDGDFIEFIRVSPHTLDVIAGDVMGKGMAAAMMGAATKLQFSRSMAELVAAHGPESPLPSPSEVVTAVDRAMTPALQALDAFVTLCYLRIDTALNTVTWVGCGHEEPLVVGADKSLSLLANQHPPLGVLEHTEFMEETLQLGPGDGLFLCSDGVTDAIRTDGERVGRARVASAVTRRMQLHSTSAAILHSLRCDLLLEGVQAGDDVTLLVIRRPPAGSGYARIELPVSLRSMKQVREFTIEQAQLSGLDEESAGLLATACIEAFTNVVRHAIGLLEDAPVELVAQRLPDRLVLDLVYLGDPFTPPEDPPETDFGLYPEGGFGLLIIRGATDNLEYLHESGVNTVRMTRMLGGATLPPARPYQDDVIDDPDIMRLTRSR